MRLAGPAKQRAEKENCERAIRHHRRRQHLQPQRPAASRARFGMMRLWRKLSKKLDEGPGSFVVKGLQWRWVSFVGWFRPRVERLFGARDTQWARVIMDRETDYIVRSLGCSSLDALEISGDKWSRQNFASYKSVRFPEYDVCEKPLVLEAFDIIIAEQVLEHLLWPSRAVRNIFQMLRPGGYLLVTTPFLLRVHVAPVDCSRWTETGMKHLLAEAGFDLEAIRTGSWGNRACIRANFRRWQPWIPWKHSLRNEVDFPVVVWALARKQ